MPMGFAGKSDNHPAPRMGSPPMKKLLLLFLALASLVRAAEPAATETRWRDLPAWRLTDGRTEAVVVPQLGGRVVVYGLVGGTNWMWTGEPGAERKNPPLYWGGDKTYLGPHSNWALVQDTMWPPPSPDFTPCEVVTPPKGLLSTLGSPWPGSGARIRRDYAFGRDGELVITHSIAPIPGSRETGALWTVAQTVPADRFLVPLAAQSPYTGGYFRFGFEKAPGFPAATALSRTLLQLKPVVGSGFKLGAHPAKPALASLKDGHAFIQRSDAQDGQYPEGLPGAGLTVEVYHHDLPGPGEYIELEQLSALRRLDQGITLVTRWNVQTLPSGSPEEQQKAVERWLGE